MNEYSYLKISYITWLRNFLKRNNNFIRSYNDEYFKNISEEDESNSNELFVFFRKLLRYAHIHNIDTKLLKDEISYKYGDTYMCFDCSLVFKYEEVLINIVILELGGASDMILRIIPDDNKVFSKNIIDIDDFYDWLNDYEYGSINCFDCSNLVTFEVDYKIHGLDYRCIYYNEFCNKEYGILAKNENRIYPCPTCRRNKYTEFIKNQKG